MPSSILDKGGVCAQIHRHLRTIIGTARNELRRDLHPQRIPRGDDERPIGSERESLCREHRMYGILVVIGAMRRNTRRLTALKETIIPLRVKETLFIESRPLKGMIDIRRQDEIILFTNQMEEIRIDIALRHRRIAVDVDAPAPPRPENLA